MRRTSRLLMITVSLLALLPTVLTILLLIGNREVAAGVTKFIADPPTGVLRILLIALFLFIAFLCLLVFVYAIFGARMKKSRSKVNDIGMIDIGVGALENISLNAAKAAQAGIKTAKARVYAAPDDQISIELAVVLYSDVEIPLQMAKIQDRVKKDVEKYTGIGVFEVKVKVTRVELIGTKVER